ncbi:deoxyribonuclease-2-beta [Acanthochromis polyacanthus]|uniref:deoxyribonuclease-2-beta n=1 Tax=Acanthochromis polyacanthus TaxID=80966 RepID=UPI002234A4A4|nr:deoxyribonuclease-2-beta [Acanthochromis polyacanthus]
MSSVCSLLLQVVVATLSCSVFNAQISCRNEAGDPVEWFVFYKLPRRRVLEEGSGVEYMYLDSEGPVWHRSRFLINSSQGAVAETLNQIYKGQAYRSNSSVYAFYNDGPPVLDYVKGFGHSKGVLLFDDSQGFWLSHSVPHFPSFPERGYIYPSSGKVNGQTGLCVTYGYDQFIHIAQQLAFVYPRFYNCSVPPAFVSDLPELVQLCGGIKPPLDKDKSVKFLFSTRWTKFISFVKSERFVDDIYTGWAAQVLGVDLLVQSWQRQGHDLPSNCSLPEHTMNIKRVRLPGSVLFLSEHDHSKWCVSESYGDDWTCLGDLNRERAQLWRGGGLICLYNYQLHQAFREAVDWYIGC